MADGIGKVFGLVFCRSAAIAKIDDVTAWHRAKRLTKCVHVVLGDLKRRYHHLHGPLTLLAKTSYYNFDRNSMFKWSKSPAIR